ncbi:MAG: hypothetical protein ACIAQU_08425 [Phycisphaerales bacterium JB064]
MGLSVGAMLVLAGVAQGQNALGDGRALDYNSRIGGTGVNERVRDYQAEFRFRNALVTGNVPGGAGFRGDAGYGMEFDFRQRVGSDDLFSFRRDSFTSGLAGTGIRGTEALQYQFALTVGNELPRNLRGSLLTSRTGERVTMALPGNPIEPTSGAVDIRQATPRELDEYEPGTLLSLRSTSSYASVRSLGPTMLQMGETAEGLAQGLVASPLRGLAREELLGDAERRSVTTEAEAEAEAEAGETGRPSSRFPSGRLGVAGQLRDKLAEEFAARAPGLAQPRQPGEAQQGEQPAAPGAQMEGEAPVGPRIGETDPFMNRLAELQKVLREGVLPEQAAVPGGEGAQTPAAGAGHQVMEQRIDGWKELVTTLKTGVGTIEVPTPKLDRASAYDLHLGRAQEMMKQGRYFEAEQRFTMALAARPGDALAAIGRVHAQIGAGLDLSAAVNLRAFLVDHPEFVAAKYEGGMLPGQDRLEAASNRLRAQLDDEQAAGRLRESALLLAYVSFHRGDVVELRLGLERLAEGQAGRRDALAPLLRAVWLDLEAEAAPEGEGEQTEGSQDAGGK